MRLTKQHTLLKNSIVEIMNEEKHRKSHSYDANSQNFVAKYGISHLTKLISLVFQQAGSFFETHCSALSNGPSSSHMPLFLSIYDQASVSSTPLAQRFHRDIPESRTCPAVCSHVPPPCILLFGFSRGSSSR